MNAARDIHIDSGEFNSIWHSPNDMFTSGWEIVLAAGPDDGVSRPKVARPTDDPTTHAARFIGEVVVSGDYYCTNYRTPLHGPVSDWVHTFPEPHGFRDSAPVILTHSMADDDSEAEEYSGQIEMLPSECEVSIVVSKLALDDLREFAASVMNVAVKAALRGFSDLETVRLLNSWFATMEETIAAGDDLEEILSEDYKLRT